jgi:hypothetical protein
VAWLRIHLTYLWRHRRLANLAAPRLLTEHVQWRKLYERDPRMPRYADKVLAKDAVCERLGEGWTIPTLWRGNALPLRAAWPVPFVVKSRHGCGHVVVVHDEERDYPNALKQSARWVRSAYGRWLDEWLYGEIQRGLLVEAYVGHGQDLPVDYKLFVFGGQVRLIQVHLERATKHRWIVFDTDWTRVSLATDDPDPARPETLNDMVAAAERLGAEFAFVRVDFFQVNGRALFGEMTFYPGSGLERVEPLALDRQMGAWWTAALGTATGVPESGIAA